MTARRFFTAVSVFAVAVVAGAISYWHQQHLAVTHGQPHVLSLIWPLCVDGLVASTGIAIATDRAGGHRPRPWGLAGFWLGVVVSVVTNWLATSGGLINHGVSAFPACAFLLAVESLSSKPRPAASAVAPAAHSVAAARSALARSDAPVSTGSSPRAPRAKSTRKPPTLDVVARAAARRPDATAAQLAAAARVSEATVRRHLRTLAGQADDATVASPSPPPPAQTSHVNGARLTGVTA